VTSLASRAIDFSRTNKFKKLLRYGSVSVISTVLTNVLLFTFYTTNLGSAMFCNALATGLVTIPAYYLNRSWTWRRKGRSDFWREVVPFWVIAFASLALSTLVVGIVAHNADKFTHTKLQKSLLINAANICTYGMIWIVRFTIYNKFLFRAPASVEPADAATEEHEHEHHEHHEHHHLISAEHEHQLVEGLVASGIAPTDELIAREKLHKLEQEKQHDHSAVSSSH
jgi:putative flippase GtrA